MAVAAAPLVIPAAEAAWAAIVTVGSALGTAVGIVTLSKTINEKFSKAEPSSIQSCQMASSNEAEGAQQPKDTPDQANTPPRARVTPERRKHILDGEGNGRGGHRAGTGERGKSEFPKEWSDDKIVKEIEDVANDPKSKEERQGKRVVKHGKRDGVDIRVVIGPNGEIITGYPENAPKNP